MKIKKYLLEQVNMKAQDKLKRALSLGCITKYKNFKMDTKPQPVLVDFGGRDVWAIKGSGSTSATTSLLVQNSAGTAAFQVKDDGTLFRNGFNFATNINIGDFLSCNDWNSYNLSNGSIKYRITGASFGFGISDSGYDTVSPSAMLQVNSTTKGFLPPRMTTTQKNAITAVAGLVLYDSTTNKLQCYNGSTWNDLF
jgi:hypothetical protein